MSAGRLYVRQIGANASEVVALVTPEMLQARADRAAGRAERVGDAYVAATGRKPLSYVKRAHALHDRLWTQAQELAAHFRRVVSMRPTPDFLVLCAECNEPHDIEATELVGANRYCSTCAWDIRTEMADAARSDDFDYHHDRGHGHGC